MFFSQPRISTKTLLTAPDRQISTEFQQHSYTGQWLLSHEPHITWFWSQRRVGQTNVGCYCH